MKVSLTSYMFPVFVRGKKQGGYPFFILLSPPGFMLLESKLGSGCLLSLDNTCFWRHLGKASVVTLPGVNIGLGNSILLSRKSRILKLTRLFLVLSY